MMKTRILIAPVFVVLILASCSTKNFVYLYEKNYNIKDTTHYHPQKPQYLLQAKDILYIVFHSVLSDAENYFSYSGVQNAGRPAQLSEGEMYLNQYVISDSGDIKIPVIGKIKVIGQTVSEIELQVETEARKYIVDVMVKVKLVNYKITFLGEFGSPGEKYFYRDYVNIMDGIANAGDITYNGDRKNIRIIRNTANGLKSFRINLNAAGMLNSEEFYLKPNDIVLAEPLPRKIFAMRSTDYSVLLLTISSTLALSSLIISLK